MTARTKGRQKHQFLLLHCLDQRDETERERVCVAINRGPDTRTMQPFPGAERGVVFEVEKFHQRNELADFFLIVARTIDQISRPWSLNTESYLCFRYLFTKRSSDSRDFVPRYLADQPDFISSHPRGFHFSTRFDEFL